MASLTALALLAVFAVFRLVTRSSLLALALFLPFVATSDIDVPLHGSPMTMSAMWPMRYGGAYLLAWLTHGTSPAAGRGRPGSSSSSEAWSPSTTWSSAAAAMIASAARCCAHGRRGSRAALRLAAETGAGVLGALGAVALLTLVRAGELPDLDLLLEWPRIFTTLGWFSMPLPTWDLHLAVYATFVAALAVAAVRVSAPTRRSAAHEHARVERRLRPARRRLLRRSSGRGQARGAALGMGFALDDATSSSCVPALAARDWRRPPLPQLLVLFGFGLAICSLGQLSPPRVQIARLTQAQSESGYLPLIKQMIREQTRTGERVAILLPLSYQISHGLDVENVAPYPFMNAIVTDSQMARLIDVLRRDNVRTIVTPVPGQRLLNEGDTAPAQLQRLRSLGYEREYEWEGILVLRRA